MRADPMFERLFSGGRTLLRTAVAEHAAPPKVALSVAVGTFCACTPLIGLHIWMALGLATLLRLNRLWAAVGSRATTAGLWPVVTFLEIEAAHRARFGVWVPISPSDAVAHGRELLLDWVLGTPLVGGFYALVLGAVAYLVARRLDRGVTSSTPGEPRPSSSESPPSAPPSPTP
jgi:hypothetical protein